MKRWEWSAKILAIGSAVVLLGGCCCITPCHPPCPVNIPAAESNEAPTGNEANYLTVGPQARFYIMHVEDRTPFGTRFPQVHRVLYEQGFDQVRKLHEADFLIDITLIAEARGNPDPRVEHILGGAILGTANGSFLGLASTADTPMIRIDIRTQGFRDNIVSSKSVVVDMAHVTPYAIPRAIDVQVSRMLQALPARSPSEY
ncbi:MAG: hypothetical protein ACLQJ7_07670 [Syntrophobacteraceae bacterium]